MKTFPELGVQIGEVLLPNPSVDLRKWAVIACDQFTSQPEYWQNVQELVNSSPSTFNMVLPEVYLGTPEEPARIQSTQNAMRRYLSEQILVPYQGLILVERTVDGKTRHGLMMALDLERYDFNKGSQSLIRATEGTILERLPPRMRIREGAPLELPHILVLIDDPQRTVIEPLLTNPDAVQTLYDTDLMAGSGHLHGSRITDPQEENRVIEALRKLSDPHAFAKRYNVGPEKGVLLFAVGDGNHSLATAKSIWEKIRADVGLDHPARYALVEIENVHDEGLVFEPIHRVLFGVRQDWKVSMETYFAQASGGKENSSIRYMPSASVEQMMEAVNHAAGPEQAFGVVSAAGAGVVFVRNPSANLPVGTLQSFLDVWLKQGGADHIDYVHGSDVVCRLGMQPGNLGFYLPAMDKTDLFKTVILDGSLPRKTFSMGEAHEKRFYMECRRITPER